ncbi:MAG: hypothetical protein Q7K71_05445 [Candidatus Omnitrophota bacterium]|nr:hypothetical protein [Candidatus Omnitrophota bacterium]
MKFFLVIFLFLLIAFCEPAQALEIVRQKNVATRIVFPIVDADGDTVTGAAGLDSEIDEFADGSNPTGFADCTNEATEIGTTGIYYLSLTATELNQDYVAIQIKTTTSGAKTQHILIRTIAGDPKAAATVTTAGNSIDVASTGEVGIDFSNVKNATGSTTLSNITIPTVTDVTNAVGVKTGTGANQLDVTSGRIKADTVYWNGSAVATPDTAGYPKVTIKFGTGAGEVSLLSGAVTVGTNTDKTGYTVSTVSDKTGYSLTQTFPTNFSSLSIDTSGRVALTPIESMMIHSGTAQAGAAGSITLTSGASSTDDLYKGLIVKIYGGTGVGQARTITAYNGTTKVATVAWNWTTNPDSTSTYAVVVSGNPSINSSLQVSTTASDPWGTALPGAYGAGTAGNILGNNLNATVSSRLASSAVPTNFSSMAITAGGAVTVGTNNDKTGYSLTQSFPSNFSLMAIDGSGRVDLGKWIGTAPNALILGRVDSNAQVVGDKTGYSLTQSFPTNFSSMAITVGGAVTVATNNDKTGYALTAGEEDAIVDKVWDELRSGHTTSATFGQGVASVQGNVTGSVASVTAGVTVSTNNDKTGYSLTSAEEDAVVDKVWDELRSGHVTSGTFGQGSSSVQGNVTGSVNSVTSGVTVSTNNDKTGYRLSAIGVDDVWDEVQSGHTSAGTFGKYLDAQVSGVTAPSAATVAAAVWDETSNHTTTGTMGKKLNDAALAGNPWDASGICSGLTAGQCLSFIKDSTDGDKEGIDYTGIEKTIRAQR